MDDNLKIATGASIVVSQTGEGDFWTIAEAVETASPGDVIQIHSGFYEEDLVITKPLSLLGDAEGLVVLANSTFELLTVTDAHLRLANVALMAGLLMHSINVVNSRVEIRDSILWAVDPFAKNSTPNLRPARELFDESFLGASMRNSIPLRAMLSDLLAPLRTGAGEGGSPVPARVHTHLALNSFDAPDVMLKSGSVMTVSNSFIGMASMIGRGYSNLSFSGCRFDYASVTSWEKSEVAFSICDGFGENDRPCIYIRDGRHPEPEVVRRERESILLRFSKYPGLPSGTIAEKQPA